MLDLPLIWAGILGFGLFAYVVLDGFDLGVGILFPWLGSREHRGTAMNTIAPVWDGNETWLVLGGGGLFATFPLAYGVVMSALYPPIIVMLLALVFRGVAFEFRWRDRRHEKFWDVAFTAGSMVATFAQGVVLGAFVQGIQVAERSYGGGWFDWLSPFSILTGFALLFGYALLGSAWLVLKTEDQLRTTAYRLVRPMAVMVFGMIIVVSIWTPFIDPLIWSRWFSWPTIGFLWPIPLLVAACGYGLYWSIMNRRDSYLLPITHGLFLICYVGLAVSIYPFIVPREFTIWQAAAPDKSLAFLLVGSVVLIPIILAYSGYSYWVFRGKVKAGEGYH